MQEMMIRKTRMVVVFTFLPNSQYMMPKISSGRRQGMI